MSMKHIAILEDDPDDRFLTEEIVTDLSINVKLSFPENGEELQNLLSTEKPDLISLDYNSGIQDTLALLRKLKSSEISVAIPVIILGDLDNRKYVEQCYRNGANSVIRKPNSIDGSRFKINTFFKYWLQVSE